MVLINKKKDNNIVDVGGGNDDIPALAAVEVASDCVFFRFKEVEEIIDGFCLIIWASLNKLVSLMFILNKLIFRYKSNDVFFVDFLM